VVQISRGKGDGENGSEDFGRFRETLDEKDKYAFKPPSLLNVTETGPWGHAGGSPTLAQAIRSHINPQQALTIMTSPCFPRIFKRLIWWEIPKVLLIS
jgi:cytochrome c peroxidase